MHAETRHELKDKKKLDHGLPRNTMVAQHRKYRTGEGISEMGKEDGAGECTNWGSMVQPREETSIEGTQAEGLLVHGEHLCLIRTHGAGQWAVKIKILDRTTILAALAEQVGEVLGGNFAFLLHLANFLLASAEVLDVLGETGLQIPSRKS